MPAALDNGVGVARALAPCPGPPWGLSLFYLEQTTVSIPGPLGPPTAIAKGDPVSFEVTRQVLIILQGC